MYKAKEMGMDENWYNTFENFLINIDFSSPSSPSSFSNSSFHFTFLCHFIILDGRPEYFHKLMAITFASVRIPEQRELCMYEP